MSNRQNKLAWRYRPIRRRLVSVVLALRECPMKSLRSGGAGNPVVKTLNRLGTSARKNELNRRKFTETLTRTPERPKNKIIIIIFHCRRTNYDKNLVTILNILTSTFPGKESIRTDIDQLRVNVSSSPVRQRSHSFYLAD